MTVPAEWWERSGRSGQRPPAAEVEHTLGGAATVIQRLGSDAGNLAVARLVAVQRDETRDAIIQDFRQLTTKGDEDWTRAAGKLGEFSADKDIVDQVRTLPGTSLERLTEGARHLNAQRVVDCIAGVNHRAAVIGTVRFHVWKHQWQQAGEYLNGLNHDDIRRLVTGLISAEMLDKEKLKKIIEANPRLPELAGNVKLQPGDTVTVGGKLFVVYATEVRQGGDLSWGLHNPGNLTCPTEHKFGAISRHPVGSRFFCVFESDTQGEDAVVKNFRGGYNRLTIEESAEKYLGPGGGDPPRWTQLFVGGAGTAAGTKPVGAQTHMSELSDAQLVAGARGAEGTIHQKDGTVHKRDDPDLPAEVREAL